MLVTASGSATETAESGIRIAERDSLGIALIRISGDVSELPEWRLSAEPLMTI
jgi:hypothetical protein